MEHSPKYSLRDPGVGPFGPSQHTWSEDDRIAVPQASQALLSETFAPM